jgi:hypothetical protein
MPQHYDLHPAYWNGNTYVDPRIRVVPPLDKPDAEAVEAIRGIHKVSYMAECNIFPDLPHWTQQEEREVVPRINAATALVEQTLIDLGHTVTNHALDPSW